MVDIFLGGGKKFCHLILVEPDTAQRYFPEYQKSNVRSVGGKVRQCKRIEEVIEEQRGGVFFEKNLLTILTFSCLRVIFSLYRRTVK